MTRQAITGGSWFNLALATVYKESTRHDGRNFSSIATGEHEAMYLSASGTWILRSWSDWQGSAESWTQIDDGTAVEWLILNSHSIPDSLTLSAAIREV